MAIHLLEESKHRITRTRELILDVILKIKSPFSANDVLAAIDRAKKSKSIDFVTVYRNLHVLEEVGVICRSDFSDEMARYMIATPGHDHHHHHIICRSCHQIEAVDFCIVEAQEKVLKKMGFKEIKHRLEFTGICRDCSK